MWSQEQGSASGPGGDARPVKGGTDRPKMEKEASSARQLGAGLDHSQPGALLRSKTSVMTTTLTSEKPSLWPRWVKAKTTPSVITFALNTRMLSKPQEWHALYTLANKSDCSFPLMWYQICRQDLVEYPVRPLALLPDSFQSRAKPSPKSPNINLSPGRPFCFFFPFFFLNLFFKLVGG